MKLSSPMRIALAGATAVVLLAVGSPETARAATAAPALNPQVVLRTLTPTEKTQYGLSALQGASGLNTIGVGQPAHVEALVSTSIPASNVLGVTWALAKPAGSTAALSDSPLGDNVPTYKMMDRVEKRLVGRTFFKPDMAGQYAVTATIQTASGTTNLTKNISAALYMGDQVCQLCHSGGAVAQNIHQSWSQTRHASMFTRAIDGQSGTYRSSCISCHTVGYDTHSNAVNGGFDDLAKTHGWTFPTNLAAGNWAGMTNDLKRLANIQCENCHGPGSEHAGAFGNTNLSNWPRIDVNFSAGNCGQCHDALSHHYKNAEWNNSRHAIATSYPTGPGRESCVRCHAGIGYMNYVDGTAPNPTYEAINCTTCHDPHDAANPHQIRTRDIVKLYDNKTTVTHAQAGNGLVCMNCHMARSDSVNFTATNAFTSRFYGHYGTQTDMFLGVNAATYDKPIPSSAHRDVVEDSCVTCHMQELESHTGPEFTKVGGHTFKMSWDGDGTNAPVHMLNACVECHGPISSFDFARQDYDGNGTVEGVQTEVKGLLARLALLLPPVGVAKPNPSHDNFVLTTNWTRAQLKGFYNYAFVVDDGSYGIHNLSYAVGLLKDAIVDLNGDLNNDGLPDKWQIQHFGSTTAPEAAPNACVTGDGIPNWAKYNLGLDPKVAGASFPGGVVWANGSKLFNSGDTNAIQIYTAAEVAFNTEAGKTYQIQGISSLGGGWQNVGTPIPGTGQTISYVTPTRSNAQQFYRVITVTP